MNIWLLYVILWSCCCKSIQLAHIYLYDAYPRCKQNVFQSALLHPYIKLPLLTMLFLVSEVNVRIEVLFKKWSNKVKRQAENQYKCTLISSHVEERKQTIVISGPSISDIYSKFKRKYEFLTYELTVKQIERDMSCIRFPYKQCNWAYLLI